MILIEALTVSYPNKKNVLDNLSLELKTDHIHGIVGLNGSGKTTLLNTLFGLKKCDSGTIKYKNSPLSKKYMSYLVTENYFYSNITGKEYLYLFINKTFNIEKWNALFKLPLNEIIDEYSSGMKKKLAILGTLKQNKPVMILDEPFNGLDIETSRILRSVLLKLKKSGKTIIITSHILETLTNLCDHIYYLENGKIKTSKEKSKFKDLENEIFKTIEEKSETLINELTKSTNPLYSRH